MAIPENLNCMFWSSDKLTGNQTVYNRLNEWDGFWSSDKLTGNQTVENFMFEWVGFWSSDKLTGNQTHLYKTRL